jgi:single-strand DNA-binding protein
MTRKTTAAEPAATAAADKPKRAWHGYNGVTLMGRLVAAPELRTTSGGKSLATMRVATNDHGDPQFHDVVAWGRTAEIAAEFGTKGLDIFVVGRLNGRTWEAADGTKRRTVEIVAEQLDLMRHRTPDGEQSAE